MVAQCRNRLCLEFDRSFARAIFDRRRALISSSSFHNQRVVILDSGQPSSVVNSWDRYIYHRGSRGSPHSSSSSSIILRIPVEYISSVHCDNFREDAMFNSRSMLKSYLVLFLVAFFATSFVALEGAYAFVTQPDSGSRGSSHTYGADSESSPVPPPVGKQSDDGVVEGKQGGPSGSVEKKQSQEAQEVREQLNNFGAYC